MAISPSSQFYDPRIDLYQDYAAQKRHALEVEMRNRPDLYQNPFSAAQPLVPQQAPTPPEPNKVLLLTGEDE